MANPNSPSSGNQILPGTSSTCLAQSFTATHDFKVTNFSLLDGMGNGNYVSSNTFSVGGYDWNIRLYPDGSGESDKSHVSVYLCYNAGGARGDTRTKFSLTLFGEDDQLISRKKGRNQLKKRKEGMITVTRQFQQTFEWQGQECGSPEFITKSKLREMLLLGYNDCFTIRCVLTVLKSRTEEAAAIVVPASDLHQDFANMLRDGDGADVTISVGDRFFLAHKHVLAARCSVFKAQLFGVMKESYTECLKIEDMEPCVFERLLHFIYTDSLSEDYEGDRNAAMLHLLVAADRYGLQRLSLMCEEKLSSWIDVQSAATILGLADRHQRAKLKEACLEFMACRDLLGAVMETESFKDLVASCPMIMKEILDKIAAC